MGSRMRIAAATCLVASGLLAGGATATMAFADRPLTGGGSDDNHTDGPPRDNRTGRQPSGPAAKKPNYSTGPRAGGTGSEHAAAVRSGTRGKTDTPGAPPREHQPGEQKLDGTKPDEHKPGDNEGQPDETDGDEGQGDGGRDGQLTTAPRTSSPPTTSPSEGAPPPDEGNCDDKKDDLCSPGWPWWPRPWEPVPPPAPGSDGGDGATAQVPSGRPAPPPRMQLPPAATPPAVQPVGPSGAAAVPGLGPAAADVAIPPITLPVIVAPATGLGVGASPPAPPSPAAPAAPRTVTAAPPTGRGGPPSGASGNVVVAPSWYRVGYPDYLRTARMSQVAALAVPGVTGILVLTGAGGWIGYRQAKAGLAMRTRGTARFVN